MNSVEILKKKISIIVNLFNAGNFSDSVRKSKLLLKENPRQIICYNILSLSLMKTGENEEAIKILNRALKYEPKNIHVLNNLGLAYYNLNSFDKSQLYLRECLKIKPDFFDALINCGNLFLTLNNPAKALDLLNNAYNLSINNSQKQMALMAIGDCYQQKGEFLKAEEAYLKILEINKNYTKADKAISLIKKYEEANDAHILNMEKKIFNIKHDKDLKHLYFALGKAYEDVGNIEKSFEYLKKGNDLEKKRINYQINDDFKFLKKIKDFFENKNFEYLDISDKKIIFIVGMPRSGTTLTEQIISSHSKVFGAGELSFISDFLNKKILNEDFLNLNQNDNEFTNTMLELRNEYLGKLDTLNFSEKIVVDKAPLNFKWIGFIKHSFPNAKIISCERNPMAICWSNYKNSFASKSLGFSYDLKDLGKFYNFYENLINFWKNRYPNEIYSLNYQKLVEGKNDEIKKLIEYCELDWEDNCLFPEKNKKNVSTASLSQVRSPIYKSSVKNWEKFSEKLKPLELELEKIKQAYS